jgi:hypothetical protein
MWKGGGGENPIMAFLFQISIVNLFLLLDILITLKKLCLPLYSGGTEGEER